MKSVWIACAILMGACAPAAAGSLAGEWNGTLSAGGAKLRLALHIKDAGPGAFTATLDSLDQGAMGLPVDSLMLSEGGAVRFEVKAVRGAYKGTVNESMTEISGTWSQGPGNLPLTWKRGAARAPARPQEPKPPYPYDSTDVTFENAGAGVTLAGTLTRPRGGAKAPAVILISGSGPQDRNEALMNHKPFLVLADHLTRAGIAVLRYDDRGTAKSTGDFAASTTEDFAADARAALAFLRKQPGIDSDRVGVLGHSEGAMAGPMVAAGNPDVAFVVMLAGPGVIGEQMLYQQNDALGRSAGMPQEGIDANRRLQEKIFAVVKAEADPEVRRKKLDELLASAGLPDGARKAQVEAAGSAWLRYLLQYDPAVVLRKVKQPVLAINGALDTQVVAEQNLPAVEAALKEGGNEKVTAKRMPGLNHLLQKATTGSVGEYREIEETMSPEALNLISGWMRQQTGL